MPKGRGGWTTLTNGPISERIWLSTLGEERMRRSSHGTKGVILVVILVPSLGLLAVFQG